MKGKAFTLVELLVVIAIIALLMAILLPALNLVRRKASAIVCLANTKNLALAWFMYQDENGGLLVGGNMESVDDKGLRIGWIREPRDINGNPLGYTQKNPPVTDEDEIRGVEAGLLYSYLKDPDVYHCPGDNIRKSIYDGTGVFVTYAIARCLNGRPPNAEANIWNYMQITKPSKRYVFVETAETRNWNMGGSFVMAAPEYTGKSEWGWWGPMAVNHGDSSILSFCDGHSEIRKWRDRFTIERVDKLLKTGGTLYGQEYPPADQVEDIKYMADGWAYRNK
jgi:prepilin-type N-terminal cleavage/methylation domain-containing protein